jgi:hypothetical protein
MIGFIGTTLQLQSVMTARNQWLSKTRYILLLDYECLLLWLYLVLIYESVTSSASVVRCLALHSWTLNFLRPPDECHQRWLSYECSLAFSRVLPVITSGEPNRGHHFQQFTKLRAYPLFGEPCVNSVATLWFHYSDFQVALTETLLSNGHPLWLNCSGFQASCHNSILPMKN